MGTPQRATPPAATHPASHFPPRPPCPCPPVPSPLCMSYPSGFFRPQVNNKNSMLIDTLCLLYSTAQTIMKKNSAVSTCTTNWPTSSGSSLTSTSGGRSPGCRATPSANQSALQRRTIFRGVWGSNSSLFILFTDPPLACFPISGLHHSYHVFFFIKPFLIFPFPFFMKDFSKEQDNKEKCNFLNAKKKFAMQNRGPYSSYFLKPFAQG